MTLSPDLVRRLLLAYYAATALFLLLDYALGINVRLSFLQPFPAARAGYYLACFACLALMAWRPSWTVLIGAFESMITIVSLIVSMWVRIVSISPESVDSGNVLISGQAVWNYVLSGSVAYLAWIRGIRQLKDDKIL